MSYQKPECNCGKELKYRGIHTLVLWDVPITKDGDFSRKKYKGVWQLDGVVEDPILGCEFCGNEYEIDWDDKGRIVRGKEVK